MKRVGTTYIYKGKKLKVVEQDGCENCYFDGPYQCDNQRILCSKYTRKDLKGVIYKWVDFRFGRKVE